MNRYMHAVGLCIGLTAVILISSVNTIFINNGEWINTLILPFSIKKWYSLGWLVSYVLLASTIGEFVVEKKLRRLLILPLIIAILTALSFFAFYKAHSALMCAIVFGILLSLQLALLYISVKNTQIYWVFVMVNSIWYAFMLCFYIIVAVIN